MFTAISSNHSHLWNIAGWTMIHYLWTGALAGLVALIGKLLLKRTSPNVRYIFALLCLGALTALPLGIALEIPLPNREGLGEGSSTARTLNANTQPQPPAITANSSAPAPPAISVNRQANSTPTPILATQSPQ